MRDGNICILQSRRFCTTTKEINQEAGFAVAPCVNLFWVDLILKRTGGWQLNVSLIEHTDWDNRLFWIVPYLTFSCEPELDALDKDFELSDPELEAELISPCTAFCLEGSRDWNSLSACDRKCSENFQKALKGRNKLVIRKTDKT